MDFKIYSRLDDITAHDKGFIQVNPSIVMAYNALPQKYIQEAYAIFWGILSNKYYGKTNKPNEDKRIYNDQRLDPEDILQSLNPEKYLDNKKIKTDVANILKKFRALQENNVFYWFNYGSSYVFFIERSIYAWKFFNPLGSVPPKSLRKIMALSDGFLQCLVRFEIEKGRNGTIEKVKKQYVKFLVRMISQMNPKARDLLPIWSEGQDISVFINDLKGKLDSMHDYFGFTCSSKFKQRVPLFIRGKVEEHMMKNVEVSETKVETEMEKDLLPANSMLGKRKRIRKKSVKKYIASPDRAEVSNWKNEIETNPLDTEKAFISYYKNFLKYYSNQNLNSMMPNFSNYRKDLILASEILDTLKDHDRKTEFFLDRWLTYFCQNHLKGTKIKYVKNTSLANLKKTFIDFKNVFYVT